jgi:hypothetical protein
MSKKTEYIDLGVSRRLNPNNPLIIFPLSGNSIVLENCFVCEELSWLKFDYTITARHTGTSFFRTIFAKTVGSKTALTHVILVKIEMNFVILKITKVFRIAGSGFCSSK